MICFQFNSVLLVSSDEGVAPDRTGPGHEAWLRVEAPSVGAVLRQVRFHRPSVLVLDLSTLRSRGESFDRMLGLIGAVRSRVPQTAIAVLGAADDGHVEAAVRQQGATVYQPIADGGDSDSVRTVVQALYARPGPARVHEPPRSGVPPR